MGRRHCPRACPSCSSLCQSVPETVQAQGEPLLIRRSISGLVVAVVGLTMTAVPLSAASAEEQSRAQARGIALEGSPALAIGDITLLGVRQRPLRLTRGVWTTVRVRVSNPGTADVEASSISGSGPGVSVRRTGVGHLHAGDSTEVEMKVRLTGKRKKTSLRLLVRGSGVQGRRALPVRRVKAPKRPVAGRYRSPNGAVTFRIDKKGRVKKFRSRTQMQCGSWPQFTYQTDTWNFPRTKIRKNGLVHRWHRVHTPKRQDSRLLEFRAARAKVTKGRFWYYSSWCTGETRFKAKRVGK